MLARQMPFAAVARIVGESPHRVLAVCQKYVQMACGLADYSDVTALAIDETSRSRGHSYVTLAADADARRVLFVTEGRDAKTIEQLAEYLKRPWVPPLRTSSRQASTCRLHSSRESQNICPTRASPSTSSTSSATPARRWTRCVASSSARTSLSRACDGLCSRTRPSSNLRQPADLDALIAKMAVKRTARAWVYKEQLREILDRKQINVVRAMLGALVHLRHALQGRSDEGSGQG
jgi:transposase